MMATRGRSWFKHYPVPLDKRVDESQNVGQPNINYLYTVAYLTQQSIESARKHAHILSVFILGYVIIVHDCVKENNLV